MSNPLTLLAPAPQQVSKGAGSFEIAPETPVYLGQRSASSLFTVHHLQDVLAQFDINAPVAVTAEPPSTGITLDVNPNLVSKPQSYRILVEEGGVYIAGADEAGLFYGVNTLCQLINLFADTDGLSLPTLRIDDWPDFPNRGVMLDVTRDRIPTMETLYRIVDMLSSLKVNQLQLYTEHTFAYAGHEIVWQEASPITPEEALLLDAYCRERHVELVPNQNSFGHMHRWLKYDRYRHLAESPEGIEHPFTPIPEPYSFCPIDPGSIALLEDLYGQLLPNFSSRQFNVGLDETFDLGLGRSKEVCQEKGTGVVYLDFLKQIHSLVARQGFTMQFWSDIIVREEPELVDALPRDVVALEWGYEADYPFAESTALIAKSGRSFYVCPGTSSWNSYAGRTDNALGNLSNAALKGLKNGAIGFLNTDWGDNGHMQPPPVSYLGYLAGAAMSWNAASADIHSQPDWSAMLDAHVFYDRAGVMGRIVCNLGLVHHNLGTPIHNSNPLFWISILPDALPQSRYPEDLSAENIESALKYIDTVMEGLDHAEMQITDAELVQSEIKWVADVLRWSCRLAIARIEVGLDQPVERVDAETRAELATELEPLIEHHRELWLQRSRIGGLADSCSRLGTMLERLRL